MSYAYNHWRREFRGPGEENCSGALVWQLNDIWPGTSWALVDVNLGRKPSFYVTKRALAKVVVGMDRVVTSNPPYMTTGYTPTASRLEVWAVNGYVDSLTASLTIKAFDIESGREVSFEENSQISPRRLELEGNRATEIMTVGVPNPLKTVVVAYLDHADSGQRLARWVSWPEPLKYVKFKRDVKVDVAREQDAIVLTSDAPVKGVVVSVPLEEGEDDVTFDDNFLDLVPGESIRVGVQGSAGTKIQARFLCEWENKEHFEL